MSEDQTTDAIVTEPVENDTTEAPEAADEPKQD